MFILQHNQGQSLKFFERFWSGQVSPPDQPFVSHLVWALLAKAKRRVDVLQQLHRLRVVNCAPDTSSVWGELVKIMRKAMLWRCLRSTRVKVGPRRDELAQVVGAKDGRVSDDGHHDFDHFNHRHFDHFNHRDQGRYECDGEELCLAQNCLSLVNTARKVQMNSPKLWRKGFSEFEFEGTFYKHAVEVQNMTIYAIWYNICRLILYLVMTSTVFVLAIQIERRQCYLGLPAARGSDA